MGYSSDSERPAKRLKPSQPHRRQPSIPDPSISTPTVTSAMAPDAATFNPWSPPTVAATGFSAEPATLDQMWTWQPSSVDRPPSQAYGLVPSEPQSSWTPPGSAVPAAYNPSSSVATSPSHSSTALLRHGNGSSASNTPTEIKEEPNSSDTNAVARGRIRTPFKDCVGTFGTFKPLEIRRPNSGFVNGYVKVRWASMSTPKSTNDENLPFSADAITWNTTLETLTGTVAVPASASLSSSVPLHSPSGTDFSTGATATGFSIPSDWGRSFASWISTTPPETTLPTNPPVAAVEVARPRMVPPQFGFQAKMETSMDRKFWEFYIKNWCPGRSVLEDTNLWLKDFAQMHNHDGVRCAIQSLAGVYIYDYVPQRHVLKRLNELFKIAESRLEALLNDPDVLRDEDRASELITIAVVLSMQDIVLTERRRAKPSLPRWLEGFLRSEFALQAMDPGSRFWHKNNVQLTSLRVSQSIIVGRAVILAQPMMPLPEPRDFDPAREASRFGWLLYGTESEMYQIHGGCGFSRKLLHVLSQITYCAARLLQEDDSPIVPMTTEFLMKELDSMSQWSSASRTWEQAKSEPHVVHWVRSLPPGCIIHGPGVMTDVTAEAWRVAAVVYLQCRAMRLPRNHPEVMANLDDLAQCIRVMPTSGTHFTAQAPLFPVFLLGLVSTAPTHLETSRYWLEQVVQTPVRSSVPPLYEALKRIWAWIDEEVPINHQETPESVGKRDPWWEHLVARVHEKEKETLCLT